MRFAPNRFISRTTLSILAISASASVCPDARAADKVIVPAGGGLSALSVDVSLSDATLRWRTCSAPPTCDGPEHSVKIDLARDELPASASGVAIAAVAVSGGRHVAAVRVQSRTDAGRAWEAIVSAKDGDAVFAGITGLGAGTPGDRAGSVVQIEEAGNGTRSIVIGAIADNTRICGQPLTLLEPRGLDPQTMELRRATLRFSKSARAAALPVVAAAAKSGAPPPLVSPLSIASASGGKATALADGDPKSAWIETRPNDGHGEFVTMRTGQGITVDRLRFVIAPDPPPQDYAAPRVFYVATNEATFEVTMPDDAALHPGQAYDVTLPRPVASDCISIVLDESYAKTKAPNVGIAEVLAYTQFDQPGASLDAIALSLRGGGQVADAASALLARAGKEGVAAIDRAWDKLDFTGRMLALDTAPASSCEDAAPVLAKGVLDTDKQLASHAVKRLERCGKKAGPALTLALEHAEATKAAKLLELFATLTPEAALPVIAPKLGAGSQEERRASRHAFALAKNGATTASLGAIEKALVTSDAKLDFWRAVAPRAPELADETKANLFTLAQVDDFATRWLVADAMAALAEKGDARAQSLLESWLASARDWPLRARVAEVWPKGRPMPAPAIARACADESPRVREALLRRGAELAQSRPDAAYYACAKSALARDAWPFVRVAAAHDLAVLPGDPSSDAALANGLGDTSIEVRVAAADGLGARRAKSQSGALMARLEDTKEDSNVRAAVARALGEVCANEALPKLTSLAKDAALPQGSGQDLTLDMAAIEALGTLHPSDLKSRLAPVLDRRAPPLVRAAAMRAIEREDVCKGGAR
jgi:hypothetical protein